MPWHKKQKPAKDGGLVAVTETQFLSKFAKTGRENKKPAMDGGLVAKTGACLLSSFAKTGCFGEYSLPPVVSKSLVCFCHLVGIFLLLECRTCVVECINQFRSECVSHTVT